MANQDPNANVLPIGLTVHLAALKTFIKYSNQYLSPRDRIPSDIVTLIAGRSGTIISTPIFTRHNIEMRRVSILTKNGDIQCQNVPIRLFRKMVPPRSVVDVPEVENVICPRQQQVMEDKHADVRNHILLAFKETMFRGKDKNMIQVDEKKSELILIGLKEETKSIMKKQKRREILNLISGNTNGEPTPAIIGDETCRYDPIGTCLMPTQANHEDNDSVDNDKDDVLGNNQEDNINNSSSCCNLGVCATGNNMFSIQTTFVENHVDEAALLDDMGRIDETNVHYFSDTVQSMLRATETHSQTLNRQQNKQQHHRKTRHVHVGGGGQSRKLNRMLKTGVDCEELSHSDFNFLDNILEGSSSVLEESNDLLEGNSVYEKGGTFELSASINNLSSTLASPASGPVPSSRTDPPSSSLRHQVNWGVSNTGASLHRPYRRSFPEKTHPSVKQHIPDPNMTIQINHLKPPTHPQQRLISEDLKGQGQSRGGRDPITDDSDEENDDGGININTEGRDMSLQMQSGRKWGAAEARRAATQHQLMFLLNSNREFIQNDPGWGATSCTTDTNFVPSAVSPFVHRIVPQSKLQQQLQHQLQQDHIHVKPHHRHHHHHQHHHHQQEQEQRKQQPCRPGYSTSPSLASKRGSRAGKVLQHTHLQLLLTVPTPEISPLTPYASLPS